MVLLKEKRKESDLGGGEGGERNEVGLRDRRRFRRNIFCGKDWLMDKSCKVALLA